MYIDDIVLTASLTQLLDQITASLRSEFTMTDMGSLHYFLGIAVTRDSSSMHLSLAKYVAEILDNTDMTACKSATTPVDMSPKLSASAGPPMADLTEYRSLVGALQYLTFMRPDIAYAIQQVCLHMHDLREQHLVAIKHILRYVKGMLYHGLQLHSSSPASMGTYTDWAGRLDTRCSTSGFCVYLGDNLVSWSSKRQHTVSRSIAEAKYHVVANTVAEATWIHQLLHELHRPSPPATVVFCDNVSVVYMSTNPVQHQRTKHIKIDLHFVRDRVSMGQVHVLHVSSSRQFADILMKGLPSPLFLDFWSSLNIRTPPIVTTGKC
jgi:hypothetical protein